MLLSELQERQRKFKLAMRAGIPVVLFIFVIVYTTFLQDQAVVLTIQNTFLISAILFISVYFIYFIMEISVKETLLDQATQVYNEKAFIEQLEGYRPKTMVLLIIKNLSTISENYNIDDVDLLLYNVIHKLNNDLNKAELKNALIARRYGAEFLIAIDKESESIQKVFETFMSENKIINEIEVNYDFAVINNIEDDLEKNIVYLKDLIGSQHDSSQKEDKKSLVKDAKEVSEAEACVISTLQSKKLLLSFRPLLKTQTNKIDIYEITVKLRSAKNGDILPRVYLPIINRLGLGREYDMALVGHIIDLLPLVEESISFSFNLSPFSLRDEHFQEKFFSLLKAQNINASRLIIELYERKTHHDLSSYLKTLNKFRAQGIRIAIDNFGSSNASMEYMKHFNFDIVQFDRDYVTKLEDANTRAMLGSLVTMSKDLNITTVAKWVDNSTQKSELKAMGIDYLQGFGISKPISEKKLIDTYN